MGQLSIGSAVTCACLMASTNCFAADSKGPSFGGISFGAGVSLTHDIGSRDRITKASVVDGIVRVDEERNDLARLVLEAHYFFTPEGNFPGSSVPTGHWGHGPFIAMVPGGNDKIIDAIGLGWMVGFRQWKWDDKGQNKIANGNVSWNFGIGLIVDGSSKALGDGITANRPLPSGESTTVRFKDLSQGGIMFVSSFSFYSGN